MDSELETPTVTEVLLLDSSTFVNEAGLTSRGASALRHYLFCRGTRLVVPEVVVEECKRNLGKRATEKVKTVQAALTWLARFFGAVSGWKPPGDSEIAKRVQAAARGEAFDAVVIPETPAVRQRAEARRSVERAPSHKKNSFRDCKIWEHCLDLLGNHDVIFVSDDGDFRGHRQPDELHPQLRLDADAVGGGRLTFHRRIDSLLSEMKEEVPKPATDTVLAFVYDAISEETSELELNSGCRATYAGTVEQQLYTTDQNDVLEVRLAVTDEWRRPETDETLAFRLTGSCRYSLADGKLADLVVTNLGLYMKQPDGSERAVKGSYVHLSASLFGGTPPIKPEPVDIERATKA